MLLRGKLGLDQRLESRAFEGTGELTFSYFLVLSDESQTSLSNRGPFFFFFDLL